jgi:hypothetical protein
MSTRSIRIASLIATLVAAVPAIAQPDQPPPPAPDQPQPLPDQPPPPVRMEEPRPTPPPPNVRPADVAPERSATFIKGKTTLTFYGFFQLYGIYDSTQGLNEQAQNTGLARPDTYGGTHGQMQISARHSRFGFKLTHEVTHDIKTSGQFEMDFLGNQPANPPGITESQFYQNATMRFRHVFATIEMPAFDIVAGQWWSLFGWQSYFHPNTLEIQGIVGQAYKRVAQLRLAKTFKSDAINVDIAVAAQRPPQRASGVPDGEAGLKVSFNKWKAWRTRGFNDSVLDAAAIGVSVIGRRLAVDEFKQNPASSINVNGYGVSLDAMLPIIPASKENHGNALTLTASFITGAGIEDQYDGLTFGTANPPCQPAATAGMPATNNCAGAAAVAPVYTPNIDGGLVLFPTSLADPVMGGAAAPHPIHLLSYMVGLQYYFPPNGRAWLSVNYTHVESNNAYLYTSSAANQAKTWNGAYYADVNLFFDATTWLRLGASFSLIDQTFVVPLCGMAGANCSVDASTNTDAKNYRGMGSVILLF